MVRERLLKRIAQWQQGMPTDPLNVPLSIMDDLEKMLNSERGNALIDPAFGLRDLRSVFGSHGALDTDSIHKELLFQIECFEPRLVLNRFEYSEALSGYGRLVWLLSGCTKSDSDPQKLNAELSIDINGRATVIATA